jgi:hypothetical protein
MLTSPSAYDALKLAKDSLIGGVHKVIPHQNRVGHEVARVLYDASFNVSSIERKVRSGLEAIDWQFITTETTYETDEGRPLKCFDITPIRLRQVKRVYHATTRAKIDLILSEGLLPSNDKRSTTGWPDTEGRIHACEKLTCHEGENECAEWWMQKLSEKVNQSIVDWGILEINLAGFTSARTHQDMHSASGIIIDRIERVPQARIKRVR